MDHEIWLGNRLVEHLQWNGPDFRYPEPEEITQQRAELRKKAIARAYELRALSYERRNEHWLESDHTEFRCKERNENEVEVETPVGTFVLQARRVKAGEMVHAVVVTTWATGVGRTATENQVSPPVAVKGRLNPPRQATPWTFQPHCFVYADGTLSDFLGSYPLSVAWLEEPYWPLDDDENRDRRGS